MFINQYNIFKNEVKVAPYCFFNSEKMQNLTCMNIKL